MLAALRSHGMPTMRVGLLVLALSASSIAVPQPASNQTTEPSIAASQPEAQTSGQNSKPKVEELGNSTHRPTFVEVQGSPVKTGESIYSEKHGNYASHEWLLVYLTGALVAITGALAWYTASLYKATVKLGDDAAQTSRRQALETGKAIAIAEQAADAATKGAETAELTAQRQLRAYLYIAAVSGSASLGVNTMSFEIKNAGATGAHRVNYCARLAFFFDPLVESELLVALAIDKDIAHIAPGHMLIGSTSIAESSTAKIPGSRLYMFGTIVYFDIFNLFRETNFCFLCTKIHGDQFVVTNADIHNRAS